MRVLVTNDDGIDSVFLHELVHALRAGGHELYVVAPKREQSWVGAAKSRNRPVHATAANRGLDFRRRWMHSHRSHRCCGSRSKVRMHW